MQERIPSTDNLHFTVDNLAHSLHIAHRIKDKFGSLAMDLVAAGDNKTKAALRQGEGVQSLARADVIHGMCIEVASLVASLL